MTHTYVELEVSKQCWTEIFKLLDAAGYQHAFHQQGNGPIVIDMHGIALVRKPSSSREGT